MAASRIAGTGRYLPAQVLTNEALAQRVDTSDEWIRTRTGIRQRHIAADDETTSDLATHAAREAIAAAGIERPTTSTSSSCATATPDMIFPSTACIVQDKLGIRNGGAAFDIAGGVLGVRVRARDRGQDGRDGRGAQRAGDRRRDLLAHPRLERPRHVRAVRRRRRRRRASCLPTRRASCRRIFTPTASHRDILCVPGTVHNGAVSGTPFLRMDGTAVFKFAVKVLADCANEALDAARMKPDDIDWVIPHQANIRIMDATMKKLQLPHERLIVTVDMHGNTSAASIPLALDIAVRDGRIREGHHVMLLGVGGGFTWGSVFLRY